ncbi:hypothetical protein AK830_g1710 [Neonectria ditissima]|uniref:Uncharacterized protein n=1 Tax=Neonectria ditissima TaxID=78410 RepID=A0A0P7BYD2_9HYPO|nr:hypothetical protein AK830_g1710 [Neonectria ditissima]
MGHVDTKQAPRKGKPWTAIKSQDFIHKVDLILPAEAYESVYQKIVKACNPPRYSRVTMALGNILEGEFFTEYIKKGAYNESYTAVVSFDLRSPTMLRGKKGFGRLIYACKNVLKQPVTWLFCDVAESTPSPDPLQGYFPTSFTSSPGIIRDIVTLQGPLDIPSEILAHVDRSALEEAATECYEWLSLIRLGSPRVEAGDNIDPYLSRYQVPGEAEGTVVVCKLSWQGLISSSWFHRLLVCTVATCPSAAWFSLSATCFSKSVPGSGDEVMVLRPPVAEAKYLMWETKTSE